MINLKQMTLAILACTIGTGSYLVSTPAKADDAGAFIGGVIATKLITNSKRRADAEEAQAAAVQQQRSAPAASSQQSPEQRIKQLDKLAAGGYITPEEYKRKKKAIIDGL